MRSDPAMFLNFRYPIVLFILSFVCLLIGFAFKVMHWSGGETIIGSMIMVQVISIVWLIIILVKTPRS